MKDVTFEIVIKPAHVTKYGKLLEALRNLDPDKALKVEVADGDLNSFRNRLNTMANKIGISMRSKVIDGKLHVWKRVDEDDDDDEKPEAV